MTDIKASLKLRQHEGWKETLEYIERLEKALLIAKSSLFKCSISRSGYGRVANEALKEISDIMGGG